MSQIDTNPTRCKEGLSFSDIYKAIEIGDDFNEPQLYFLSRLVERKLRVLHRRFNLDDLQYKPYSH